MRFPQTVGMDSLVFLDDNPFERNLVRSLIPDAQITAVGTNAIATAAMLKAGADRGAALCFQHGVQLRRGAEIQLFKAL